MRKNYPNNIFMHRKKRGLTQKQVALLMGLKDESTISCYERGAMVPDLERLLKLAFALNTPVEALYFDIAKQFQAEIMERREVIFNKNNNLKRLDV